MHPVLVNPSDFPAPLSTAFCLCDVCPRCRTKFESQKFGNYNNLINLKFSSATVIPPTHWKGNPLTSGICILRSPGGDMDVFCFFFNLMSVTHYLVRASYYLACASWYLAHATY